MATARTRRAHKTQHPSKRALFPPFVARGTKGDERDKTPFRSARANDCSALGVFVRLRTHNQNITVAARATAERKTFGHLS